MVFIRLTEAIKFGRYCRQLNSPVGYDILIDMRWVRTLTVPMHLGLIDWPFVPHNLSSAQLCTFTKVPDGPQTSNPNILWVEERNPDILFFSLEKSWQANPLAVSPTWPSLREMPAYRALLHVS